MVIALDGCGELSNDYCLVNKALPVFLQLTILSWLWTNFLYYIISVLRNTYIISNGVPLSKCSIMIPRLVHALIIDVLTVQTGGWLFLLQYIVVEIAGSQSISEQWMSQKWLLALSQEGVMMLRMFI